ncbi:hypothetical protein R1flu_018612 [Riccia fluitans]|uniref:AAA+ ATPase domain-containing protein n=1 Tax=Riccia fluitans TaxID=41844 RepID=A0ABD1ZJV2_9MARC
MLPEMAPIKLNDAVYEIYRPASGPISLEIVFFHGFQSPDCREAPVDTRMPVDEPASWLSKFLAEEFPQSRILSVSYDSSTEITNTDGRMNMYIVGENLVISIIELAGVGQTYPVVLVGYSVGGLVLKEVCCRAEAVGSTNRPEDSTVNHCKTFLRSMKGAFFISTAQMGTRIPAASKRRGPLLEYYEFLNKECARLNSDFGELRKREQYRWKTFGVCETAASENVQRPSSIFKRVISSFGENHEPLAEASARHDVDRFCAPEVQSLAIHKPKAIPVRSLAGVKREPLTSEVESTEARNQGHSASPEDWSLAIREPIVTESERINPVNLSFGQKRNREGTSRAIYNPYDRTSSVYQLLAKFLRDILHDVEWVKKRWLDILNLPEQFVATLTVEDLIARLRLGEPEPARMTIVGMGGIGKTTLAKAVLLELRSQFDYVCFIEDLKEKLKEHKELHTLIGNSLYTGAGYKIRMVDVDQEAIWERLKGKRVLLIMDNIDSESDIRALLIPDWVDEGSRFITTSRVRSVEFMRSFIIYDVPFLSDEESEKLFRRHIHADVVGKIPNDMIRKIVDKCDGLPLTIEVIGRYLYREKRVSIWRGALERLKAAESINGSDDDKLWAKLRVSFDKLRCQEREMFLDLASFDKDESDGLQPPGKVASLCRGLWKPDDVDQFSKYPEVDAKISVAVLISVALLPKLTVLILDNVPLYMWMLLEVLCVLKHLRILIVRRFSKEYGRSSDFRAHLPSLGAFFLEQCQLAKLDYIFPAAESILIRDCQFLEELSLLVLSSMKRLMLENLPALPHLPRSFPPPPPIFFSLQDLWIIRCKRLELLPEELGKCTELSSVQIKECDNLEHLWESLGSNKSLSDLSIDSCFRLRHLPNSLGQLTALQELKLCRLGISILPDSIGALENLRTFWLSELDSMESLPDSIGQLKSLKFLRIQNCGTLNRLPETVGQLHALELFELEDCASLDWLPVSLRKLREVTNLVLKISSCAEFSPV